MQISKSRVIKNWSQSKKIVPFSSGFKSNGYGRRYAMQDQHPLLLKAFQEFDLTPQYVEPVFKVFTGNHYLDGAHTHKHTDSTLSGFVHVRCNLMIKKSPKGGNPVIDDVEIDVQEGDLWLCAASEEEHSSTPIQGGERIIMSFGGLVPRKQFEERLVCQQ